VLADLPPGAGPLQIQDPSMIGGYRLLGRLGFGGMGAVYLAVGAVNEQMVAIKTLHPALAGDPDSRLRFRAERDFGRRVSSPYIPAVVADDTEGACPYIVAEYIRGVSLAERVDFGDPLEDGPLEALAIGVAAALVAIHTAGLVHRDLKPANVMLSPDGLKVIDFGIARDLEAAGGLTQTGVVMGSPGWIAPERLAGRPGCSASDVFGWGCLVAYAATGRSPFGSGSAAERTAMVLSGFADLTGLTPPWRDLVALAVDKDPEVRPESDVLLRTLLSRRGGPPGPLPAAESYTGLWTVPQRARHPEPLSSPDRWSSASVSASVAEPVSASVSAASTSKRRTTVGAWTVTAVATTVAVAVTVAGASRPDTTAGPGTDSTERPASSSATPTDSVAPSAPVRPDASRPTRRTVGRDAVDHRPAPAAPPSRQTVKKPKKDQSRDADPRRNDSPG
jgi:serine/threonine protein kinase